MKKHIILTLLCYAFYFSNAQSVSINTDGSAPAAGNMLEIKKAGRSKVAIKSTSYLNDTTELQLSNRLPSGAAGTDLNIQFIKEAGLYFNTTSDFLPFINDSLFTMLRNGQIGIGTKTPVAKLDVIGSLRIADGTQAANKVLVSNATGLASWQPKTFGFAATGTFPAISNVQSIPNAVNTQVTVINLEEYDTNGMYNAATGVVTIAETGVYHVDISINYTQASIGNYNLSLVVGGSVKRLSSGRVYSATFTDNLQLTISADISVTAGQTVRIFTEQNSGNSQLVNGGFFSWFNMHKLY
jgi:hypothetical protein